MKKVLFLLLGFAALLIIACGGQDQKTDPAGNVTKDTTITQRHIEGLNIQLLNGDSIIQATVEAGKIPDSLELKIDHPYQQVHIVIQGISKDSLVGELTAAGAMRNIRFNQIVMPDSTMDGPFGHDIHYRTALPGKYTLILGKDNMADGTVEGPLKVHIELK